jgi:ABC-type methionine transport system permease subunit
VTVVMLSLCVQGIQVVGDFLARRFTRK